MLKKGDIFFAETNDNEKNNLCVALCDAHLSDEGSEFSWQVQVFSFARDRMTFCNVHSKCGMQKWCQPCILKHSAVDVYWFNERDVFILREEDLT